MNHRLQTRRLRAAVLAAALGAFAVASFAQDPLRNARPDFSTDAEREAFVSAMRERSRIARSNAWERAAKEGWTTRGVTPDGRVTELQEIADGMPVYLITENVNAAISTAANLIRDTSPFNVNGNGFVAGVWDGGAARSTHQEVSGRVSIPDGSAVIDHATHVAGTMIASGRVAAALGMAPRGRVDSYDWNSDTAEMASRGMATSGQAGRLPLSNHSYGTISGWDFGDWSGTSGWHWWGLWGSRESDNFGQYDSEARAWDQIVAGAPYYLPFKSAGNDRNDDAPAPGTTFFYINGSWLSKSYDASTDPFSDGWDNGGYDTIPTEGVAKNVMTVGAVNDAVSGGSRSIANATMSAFSGWGPADDGRIKPDIVANGVSLYSSVGTGDADYANYSGTSMSTPNASGSALLLVEYFVQRSGGTYPRASTLKALILHTADDLGNAGPDYRFGWGLMNARAAAGVISNHFANPGIPLISEPFITSSQAGRTNLVRWDGTSPIRATLCWTDPAGSARTAVDDARTQLVNDLDLRIVGPTGITNFPYILNRTNPAALATTGDNDVDNVEQVYIASPPAAGTYQIIVEREGPLTGLTQHFSLVLSGVVSNIVPTVSLLVTGTPSAIGIVGPGYGLTNIASGAVTSGFALTPAIVASASSLVTYAATGWTGRGSVPASGVGTNTGAFTLLSPSTLIWHWVATDMVLSNRIVTTTETISARDTLAARDGFIVRPPSTATLNAGRSVRLQSGFRAESGAVLRVRSP